ncbi:MAG: glycosyltransferase family 4 protein [Alphaproteobacteria bacterium]
MTRANAAIFYASDGYRPKEKGINGRRVAGESFLKGFLSHADVTEFVILAKSTVEAQEVSELSQTLRPAIPLRAVGLLRPGAMAPVTQMYYPAANFASEAWRRADSGSAAWTICGITHTTSTMAIMQGFYDLRMGPVMEWDALICTSASVRAAVIMQMDLIDAHIRQRFRTDPPPRPMLPVVPLGIHTDDFARNPAARAALRNRLNCGPQDVVFSTIARLTPHEKFDPLPIFIAMQQAQAALPKGQKLHVVFCGVFRHPYAKAVFVEGAARLMPDVGFLLLDGASPQDRLETLSGADVSLFIIDNIQETFGLAPLEGMAAGLPLLVSDWDGMKDTVPPAVGFRVKTRTLGPMHLASESLRLQGGIDDYSQYCASVSALTEVDMPDLTARILQLATNPGLRDRLGAAALQHVRRTYDWATVIPQMQDLWAEQERRRIAGLSRSHRIPGPQLPIAPSPTLLFAAYPTEQIDPAQHRYRATGLTGRPNLTELLALRNYAALKRLFASEAQIASVLAAVTSAGENGTDMTELVRTTTLKQIIVDRVLIWLLKYDFIRRL